MQAAFLPLKICAGRDRLMSQSTFAKMPITSFSAIINIFGVCTSLRAGDFCTRA